MKPPEPKSCKSDGSEVASSSAANMEDFEQHSTGSLLNFSSVTNTTESKLPFNYNISSPNCIVSKPGNCDSTVPLAAAVPSRWTHLSTMGSHEDTQNIPGELVNISKCATYLSEENMDVDVG